MAMMLKDDADQRKVSSIQPRGRGDMAKLSWVKSGSRAAKRAVTTTRPKLNKRKVLRDARTARRTLPSFLAKSGRVNELSEKCAALPCQYKLG